MSIYEQNISAFIDILETASEQINTKDWQDLQEFAANLPSTDDTEELSQAIDNWLESHPLLAQAYEQRLIKLPSSELADKNIFGNTTSPTPPNQPSPAFQELIINSIQKNSPLSNFASSPPPPNQP